jgi:hypothetical protein
MWLPTESFKLEQASELECNYVPVSLWKTISKLGRYLGKFTISPTRKPIARDAQAISLTNTSRISTWIWDQETWKPENFTGIMPHYLAPDMGSLQTT